MASSNQRNYEYALSVLSELSNAKSICPDLKLDDFFTLGDIYGILKSVEGYVSELLKKIEELEKIRFVKKEKIDESDSKCPTTVGIQTDSADLCPRCTSLTKHDLAVHQSSLPPDPVISITSEDAISISSEEPPSGKMRKKRPKRKKVRLSDIEVVNRPRGGTRSDVARASRATPATSLPARTTLPARATSSATPATSLAIRAKSSATLVTSSVTPATSSVTPVTSYARSSATQVTSSAIPSRSSSKPVTSSVTPATSPATPSTSSAAPAPATSSAMTPARSELDAFGQLIAAQLNAIPLDEALQLQPVILQLIVDYRFGIDRS